MNDAVRALFPVTERFTYLNHAAVSPPPAATIAAVAHQRVRARAPFAGAGVPSPSDLTELTELVASGQLAALLGGSRTGSS